MKNRILWVCVLLLIATMFLSIADYQIEAEKRSTKEDLIELSKIKYGLFSVDEWKRILSEIITKKIEQFNLEGGNKEKMRKELELFLYQQISELEERYYEEKSQSFFGFIIQNPITAITGVFGKIKRDIPIFTEQILNFLNDPKNRKAIREYILAKLNEYADKTFSKIDYSRHNKVISDHGFQDRDSALVGLADKINQLDKQAIPYRVGLISLGVVTILLLAFTDKTSKALYIVVSVICFLFLVTGLLLPMIEIDARIAEMSFNLLGEPIKFQDQVLYYKSKSILEVVRLMITQNRIDLIFVGLLVLTFSVLFPATKLICSIFYINSDEQKDNTFVRFMVFKTGKWSMADVMVIAIFMAYIGFSGIISEQLEQIESITQTIDIVTTNRSSLMMGFYTFTCFAVLSLLIAHKLQFPLAAQDHPPSEAAGRDDLSN